uniref:Uncharacterized protein n=1 Tax=Steinernema glaseri TaxID=37863 RepID=A0A1I7Y4S3_9BILA
MVATFQNGRKVLIAFATQTKVPCHHIREIFRPQAVHVLPRKVEPCTSLTLWFARHPDLHDKALQIQQKESADRQNRTTRQKLLFGRMFGRFSRTVTPPLSAHLEPSGSSIRLTKTSLQE